MTGFWPAFQQTYLRFDRRVLGLFRIGLSLVLLYDLGRRFPDAALLWSNDGVLTTASLRKVPQGSPQLSFLFGFESGPSVELAFAAMGVVFVLYGAGLFTRWMQVLALVLYSSLNARNLFFEDGGTGTTILLLGWTLLLPLNDRFSLDALRRDAALPTLRARCRSRAEARLPLITFAALCVLLQASVIYLLNAVHKNGHTWRAGDAVHLVLWQHRVNTPFALWFAQHEPAWFSPFASSMTKRTELLLPVLLLWPTQLKLTRPIAFVLALGLHLGIALCLTLGPFSYAMICLVWLAMPGAALDELVLRTQRFRGFGWRLARVRARVVATLSRWRLPRLTLPALWQRRGRALREVVLGYMLLVEAGSVLCSNPGVPRALRIHPGPVIDGYKPYVRGFQGWSMFAPDAPTEDGTLVVDAVTRSGRHLDPFNGRATDFEQIRRGLAPHSIAQSDYFLAMRSSRNSRYRLDLARYVRASPHAPAGDPFVALEAWWVSYVPPKRGSYEPGPLKKERLWRTKLTRQL
ncbi:MAG TPA: HTTM domain-containing protein [Polyangiaceae bacterium]|nr:HTTM domain-containing protein [Polyangiaceae bacterium]